LYGGFEDLSDSVSGVAAVVNANRLIFDGGKLDAIITHDRMLVESSEHALSARKNEKAFELSSIWVDLERYRTLKSQIGERLLVLDPLIQQVERVADAGIGDVAQVAAAKRTISTILVMETEINEQLEQARLNFMNSFGRLPDSAKYNQVFVSSLVPASVSDDMGLNAPAVKAEYAAYLAAEAAVASVKAKEGFDIGFEAAISRPFGASERDSDEQVGFVARKTFYTGKMLESEISRATAGLEGQKAVVKATFREGERRVRIAMQNIMSMDKAILLARENAAVTRDEIVYLRQQLVIGGSTLDSILSAEARLYDAEASEINLTAERRKSELTVISALGLFFAS
jgi:outer membrane protein TolC